MAAICDDAMTLNWLFRIQAIRGPKLAIFKELSSLSCYQWYHTEKSVYDFFSKKKKKKKKERKKSSFKLRRWLHIQHEAKHLMKEINT